MHMHRIVLFLLLLTLSSFKNADNRHERAMRYSGGHNNAPDFTLQDSANHTVTLSQFKGKFVVICMEANWCRPCLEELKATKEMQANLLGQNIVWVFISFDRDKESWDEARRENNIKGIQLWGKPKSEDLKKTFRFDSLPYFIWIDKDGTIAMDDAPRPSVRNTIKQLRVYLNG